MLQLRFTCSSCVFTFLMEALDVMRMMSGFLPALLHARCNRSSLYRASHVLEYLGWVDIDLGSSPGWWATNVATYCPRRVVEHSKSNSTKPSLRGHGTPCTMWGVHSRWAAWLSRMNDTLAMPQIERVVKEGGRARWRLYAHGIRERYTLLSCARVLRGNEQWRGLYFCCSSQMSLK